MLCPGKPVTFACTVAMKMMSPVEFPPRKDLRLADVVGLWARCLLCRCLRGGAMRLDRLSARADLGRACARGVDVVNGVRARTYVGACACGVSM